jgi:hypothetical protein
MNHWPFVIVAYAIALGVSVGLTLWSWRAMRFAERRADEILRK